MRPIRPLLLAGLAASGTLTPVAAAQPIAIGLRLAAALNAGAQPPEDPPPAEPAPAPAGDPAVDRMIEDLERASSPRRPVEPRTPGRLTPARPGVLLPGVRPIPAGRGAASVIPEGTFLPSRSGRMNRSPEGQWIFTFDGGPDGAAEPPMVLLPCEKLMEMEVVGEGIGESAVMTVSGLVYVYHGRNYLMPTFFRTVRRTEDLIPTQ